MYEIERYIWEAQAKERAVCDEDWAYFYLNQNSLFPILLRSTSVVSIVSIVLISIFYYVSIAVVPSRHWQMEGLEYFYSYQHSRDPPGSHESQIQHLKISCRQEESNGNLPTLRTIISVNSDQDHWNGWEYWRIGGVCWVLGSKRYLLSLKRKGQNRQIEKIQHLQLREGRGVLSFW